MTILQCASLDRASISGQQRDFTCAWILRIDSVQWTSASGLSEQLGIDRKPAQALAGRGKDRVRNGRHHGAGAGLAHSARIFETVDDVGFNGWRLVNAQNAVVVEVTLLDASAFDRDLTEERRGDSEDHGAFNLRLDSVGVDN